LLLPLLQLLFLYVPVESGLLVNQNVDGSGRIEIGHPESHRGPVLVGEAHRFEPLQLRGRHFPVLLHGPSVPIEFALEGPKHPVTVRLRLV
jgi:hypothetical protein